MSIHRETAIALATNLQRLMDHHQLSQAQLAKRAGVGQRTLSTLLNKDNPLEMNPRSTTIDQLAAYFGIPSWQLVIPDLPIELLLNGRLGRIIHNYRAINDSGRDHIDRVAEAEVRYAAIDTRQPTRG